MTMSAAAYLPKDHSPGELASAIERQAVWIERQNQTNQAHWTKIRELEEGCKDCRNDRRAIDQLVLDRLDELKTGLAEIRSAQRWAALTVKALFALATLAIAARAAGILK